jgi:hypothetical protein
VVPKSIPTKSGALFACGIHPLFRTTTDRGGGRSRFARTGVLLPTHSAKTRNGWGTVQTLAGGSRWLFCSGRDAAGGAADACDWLAPLALSSSSRGCEQRRGACAVSGRSPVCFVGDAPGLYPVPLPPPHRGILSNSSVFNGLERGYSRKVHCFQEHGSQLSENRELPGLRAATSKPVR